MILEFGVGHKYRSGAPLSFAKINRNFEWLGWWQILVCFFIAVYYVAVIAWAISYIVHSGTLAFSSDPKGFFFGNVLGLTDNPFQLGTLRVNLLIPLLLAWGVNFVAIYRCPNTGLKDWARP